MSKFLDTRSRALKSSGTKVTQQPSLTPPCNQGNQTLTKRVQNYAVQDSSCESCQEDHRLYACSQFKGMCLADRHKFVKDKKLCFNCFQSGHSSNACPSKFTCRECKMKYHTLLHRAQKQLPDQRTSTKAYSSMNSTSNKMESTKQFTTGHFSADNEINTVLFFYISCNNSEFIRRCDQAAGSLRFWFTSQFRNRRYCKGAHAAISAQPNKCFYQGFFPFPKNSRLIASEVE